MNTALLNPLDFLKVGVMALIFIILIRCIAAKLMPE